ncbi:hypothetical protein EPO66_05775, partial [bacterium]
PEGLILFNFGCKELPLGIDSAAKEAATLDILRFLTGKFSFRNSKLIVAINCPKTAMRRLTAPLMPMDQLRARIEVELRNYFSFSVDDAVFDLEMGGKINDGEHKKYRLIVATSSEKTLEKHFSLLSKAGLSADAFVPASYGLEKLFVNLYNKEEAICLLDIGASATELVIFKGKEMVFSRKIPVGGDDFTKALSRELATENGRIQISGQEAETIKRECGLPLAEDSKIIDGKVSSFQVLSMLRPVAEQLVSEIVRCFDYYREELGDLELGFISLSGGGSYLKGLDVFLKNNLGIEIRAFDPLKGLKIKSGLLNDNDDLKKFLAVAIGAALSEGKGINLLPSEIKEQRKYNFKRNILEIIISLAVLFLLVVYFGLTIRLNNLKKGIAVTQMEMRGVLAVIEDGLTDNLSGKILADEPYWEDVFKELSNVMPDNVYLKELSVENKIMHISIVVVSGSFEDTLSGLINTLSRGLFKDAKIVNSSEQSRE